MRLLFKPSCSCPLSPTTLPKPSFRITQDFDTDDAEPAIYASADLLCAACEKPWESFAGLAYLPKKPKLATP